MALISSVADKKCDITCQGCPWFSSGEFVAPVFSTHRGQITVVQEAPTFNDLAEGEPCTGDRGDILETWLRECSPPGKNGYALADTHKLFAVKCHDLSGKKPGIKVVRACAEHLKTDIEYTTLKGSPVVVSMGATATRAFTSVSKFSDVRGQPQKLLFGKSDITLFPTMSPANIIALPGQEPLARKDFQSVIRMARGESLSKFKSRAVTKLILLSSRAKVRDFFQTEALKHKIISCDIEGTAYDPVVGEVTGNALDYLDSNLLTLNFSYEEGSACILPLMGFKAKKIWSNDFLYEIGEMCKEVMALPGILWVFHNAGFDIPFLVLNYGVDLEKLKYVDTLLMSHLLSEEAPKDLKTLATVHTELGGYESVLSK